MTSHRSSTMHIHGPTGKALVQAGIVDAAGLARALEAQAKRPATLGRILAELGLSDEPGVARAIASAMRLEFYDGEISGAAATSVLPADFCRKRSVFPLGVDGNRLRLAVTDPLDYSVLQDVEFRTEKRVIAVLVTETWLERALGIAPMAPPEPSPACKQYDTLQTVEPVGQVEPNAISELDLVDPVTLARDTNLPPIVKLVNLILSEAAAAGASDIHVEPQESFLNVRHRVDGLLREVLTVPLHLKDQTISRLKIISGMDIAERRKPQDGRSRLRYEGRRIDLRVSTLPTQHGEKVVIRLLNSDRAIQPLEQLGFAADNLRMIRTFLSRPQGMILVTGPTGSGKTSTLYTALKSIKSPTNNIITLEDPIELQLPGVNQMQVNVKAGVTFADGLRSILRQDPNIILVGEIRDAETAGIAMQAAQTGHLVLSTLHTDDAPSCVTRLSDIGIEPYVTASALVGVVAQRLVRRLCPDCRCRYTPEAETLRAMGLGGDEMSDPTFYRAVGCHKCNRTGYRGRVGIYEIMRVTDDMRRLIAQRDAETQLRDAAIGSGMISLGEDGLLKAMAGMTTPQELLRVVTEVRQQSRRCTECKARLSPDFIACPACGQHAGRACPHCRRSIQPEWRFCPYCATSMATSRAKRSCPVPADGGLITRALPSASVTEIGNQE
jgi:type IV pilus assembly protein PilB